MSSRLAPYIEAYEGLVDSLATPVGAIHMDAGTAIAIGRETRVIVTFGTRAALATYPEQAVRIHCMAPGAPGDGGQRADRAIRVHMLPPPAQIMAALRVLQPRLSRLGVLRLLPLPEPFAAAMDAAADSNGVEVIVEPLAAPEMLPEHLRALMREGVDALWLPPDPLLINPRNIAVIREFSWSNDVPFYAPTSGLAESGAVATVAPSFRQIGCAAARQARHVLDGVKVQRDVFPREHEITVNTHAAERAGSSITAAALGIADRLIDGAP